MGHVDKEWGPRRHLPGPKHKHARHLETAMERVGWGQQPWDRQGRTHKDRGERGL
jgi:hypothetical protein